MLLKHNIVISTILILGLILLPQFLYSWQSVEERLESTIVEPTPDNLVDEILGQLTIDTNAFELSELSGESIVNQKPIVFGDIGFDLGGSSSLKISGKEGISSKYLSEGFTATWDETDKNGSPYLERNLKCQGDIAFDPNEWSSVGSQFNRYYYKRGTSSGTDLSKSGIIEVVNLSFTKGENLQLLIGSEIRRDEINYRDKISHTGITSKAVLSFIKPEINLFQIENNNYFDKSSNYGYYQKVIDTFINDTLNFGSRANLMSSIGIQTSLNEKNNLSLKERLSLGLGYGFGLFSEAERRRLTINWDDLFTNREYILPIFPLQKPLIDLGLKNGFVYNVSDGNSIETSLVYSKITNFIYTEQGEDLPFTKNTQFAKELGFTTTVELNKNFTTTNITLSIMKKRDENKNHISYEPTIELNANSTLTPIKQVIFLIGVKAENERIVLGEFKLGGLFILNVGCKIKPIDEISIDFNVRDLLNKTHLSVYNQEDRGRVITGGIDISIL